MESVGHDSRFGVCVCVIKSMSAVFSNVEKFQKFPVTWAPSLKGLNLCLSQVKVMADDRAEWEGRVFLSEPLSPLPPLATTSCVVEDAGDSSQEDTGVTEVTEELCSSTAHRPVCRLVGSVC